MVFDALTASVMYTWHWEESFWREVGWRMADPIVLFLFVNAKVILRGQSLILSSLAWLLYSIAAALPFFFFYLTFSLLPRSLSFYSLFVEMIPLSWVHLYDG